jgi:hypothetical protein
MKNGQDDDSLGFRNVERDVREFRNYCTSDAMTLRFVPLKDVPDVTLRVRAKND